MSHLRSPHDYDSRAPHFGEAVLTYRDAGLSLLMLESLQLNSNLRAADLGAGQGDSSRHLMAAGIQVFYLDQSVNMLRRGFERRIIPTGNAILYRLGEPYLPFRDNSLDIVTTRYTMHDIKDKLSVLKEVCRVLRPSGKVQIVDMCAEPELLHFYHEVHRWKTMGPPAECHIPSEKDYLVVLESAGFEVLSINYYSSVVESIQWIAEGQITAERHAYILSIVEKYLDANPSLAESFGLSLTPTGFVAHFPVVLLVGKSMKEE